MIILAVTDIHGRKNAVDELKRVVQGRSIDYVVVAGDITHFGSIGEAQELLWKLAGIAPVLFVPGNCDPPDLLYIDSIGDTIFNIHGRLRKLNNYLIYGIGGSITTPFNTAIEYSEKDLAEFINRIASIDTSRVIIVSHNPPYGILDKTLSGIHAGSKTLRSFLDERKPILWITGHIHEARGVIEDRGVTVVNPGPLFKKYYAVIEIAEDGETSVRLHRF